MEASNTRAITLRGGLVGLVAVLLVVALEAVVPRVLTYGWTRGPSLPVVELPVIGVAVSIGALVAGIALLGWEGVELPAIGAGLEFVLPAAVVVGSYFAGLNAIAAGLAVTSGHTASIGYHWTVSPVAALWAFLVMLIVAGLVEEFLFRGYLQTKLIATLDGTGRSRIAIGIVLAGLVFSAYHLPRVAIDGPPAGMTAIGYLALLATNGVLYGLLYEVTHNLYVPVLVHAAGNMPGTAGILFVVPDGWPTWAFVTYQLASLGVFVAALVAYRRWAFATDRMPVWRTRREANSPG